MNCADINIINGHIVLPEVMAPDADLCKSLVCAGRAAEVQAEIERREWLRSAEGQAHLAAIVAQIVPMSAEERAACDAAAEAARAAAIARHNRRAAKLRARWPQHAEHFRAR